MTDRRRNLFVLLLVAGLLVASLAVIVTQADAAGPGPQGRRLAHLPGQADQAVDGHRRRHRPLAGHHAQARRPDRRRRAEPPALGRRPDRRLAARRQERRRGGLAGRHHRPDVVLRLGGQRPRAELQARSAEPERDRRAGGRRRGIRRAVALRRRHARRQVPARRTPARSPRATSSTWSTRRPRRSWRAPTRASRTSRRRRSTRRSPSTPSRSSRSRRARSSSAPSSPTPRASRRRPGTSSRTSRSSAARTSRTPSRASTTARARAASRTSPSTSPARRGRVVEVHAQALPARPGVLARRAGRRVQPALRDRARQRADLGPADRLAPVPRRPRRRQRLADLGRLHDRLRPAAGQPAQDGRPADQARADLGVAGLGHAGQAGAQPGPRRGRRGLRHRRALPAHLLPRAGRHRGRRPRRLRDLLLRADQARADHDDAAGHRGPDPHDRRRGRREHRHLRTRQGGAARRQIDPCRHRHGLQARPVGDRRRQRRDLHGRVHPLPAGHGRGQGLRLHAGRRHAGLLLHRGAADPGRAGRDGALASSSTARPRWASARTASAGASTTWAPRSGSSRCRA